MSRKESSRSVALDVLLAVERDDAYANLLLPQRISKAHLAPNDAGLATELCNGTLRWQGFYDQIINRVSSRDVQSLAPTVRNILRMTAHQLLGMRTSTHAAVNEAVQLSKDFSYGKASGFVNAVSRRTSEKTREEWQGIVTESVTDDTERLSALTSHPSWIVRALKTSLVADDRAEELAELLKADNAPGPLGLIDLRLTGGGVPDTTPSRFSPLGMHLLSGGNPASVTREFAGKVRVQDEGSQLAALALLAAKPLSRESRLLDMCAAPGGKAAIMAAYAEGVGAAMLANEVNPKRISLVRSALNPWAGVQSQVGDARDFAQHPASYSHILLDAPCSGLGALRRRPESRWRKKPSDIASLTGLQAQLLEAAWTALEPGGVMAYVTCSPHLAETRSIIAGHKKKHDDAVELNAWHVLDTVTRERLPRTNDALAVQLWPHIHATDAMFIALLQKPAK